MEKSILTETDEHYFRVGISRLFDAMFKDTPIDSASKFFKVWQETRDILEEELKRVVNFITEQEIETTQKPA